MRQSPGASVLSCVVCEALLRQSPVSIIVWCCLRTLRTPPFVFYSCRVPAMAESNLATTFLPFVGLIKKSSIGLCITVTPFNCLEVTLSWEIIHFKIIAKLNMKMTILYSARSNLQPELRENQKNITDASERRERRINFERLVSKLKDAFSKLVQQNGLFGFR